MKKLLFIISAFLIISSCSTTREARSAKAELRSEKKLAEQIIVKQAVESGRFIIKLDRIYLGGRTVELIPRANYIIVDGKKAVINAAYFGRQYDIMPIAGINIRGSAKNYELTSKLSKGVYEIKMKVENRAASFDVYITIGNNGTCNASVTSLKIDYARYRGYIVPIENGQGDQLQNNRAI